MKNAIAEKFRWRMAEWLWTPPRGMPASDPAYGEWMKPPALSVEVFGRVGFPERGREMVMPKRIDKLNYRGSRSRHEVNEKHAHKAVLPFRGKGSKIERRSAKSRKQRKMS